MNKLSKLLLAVVAPAFLLAACGGGGSDDNLDDRTDTADPKIRFVHAVPVAPDVTLYHNGNKVREVDGVNYKFASQYLEFNTGDTDLMVKTTGADVQVGSKVPFEAERGHKYTLVALPALAGTDLHLIDDPYDKGLLSDKARVRVLHAAFNSAAVDVYLTRANEDIATLAPRFSNVGFKQTQPRSGEDSLEVEGHDDWRLRITSAGTKDVLFDSPVKLGDNADWLLTVIPSGGIGSVIPNDFKVLVVKADDGSRTTQELTSQD
ncbi:DUF4397 domain-containing protein [Eleftheria terrae]|uniref:DUF4397 domain-containing protein n=1 Tax=Eleftheria terrae TaxID=1597781 RepID=UPI00263B864B|nr:DUF4397 domain-containing protein [Eleftheria terrae]WKB52497.1 DUF4397 domain-containing protein [Eleftheria terrae]